MNDLPEPLLRVDLPDVPRLRSGKVREVFDLGDKLLLVATDRISAYDSILPNGIPCKGQILTQLSQWWFERTADWLPNHLLPQTDPILDRPGLRGRSVIVRRTRPLPIECVVRGYLAGSGWAEYQQTGTVAGIKLPVGLQESSELPEPIFTPATKAETGHDENITFDQAAELIGIDLCREIRTRSIDLYLHARHRARERGVIIADTKFEFGLCGSTLLLIDEILTPDSSRFWPADDYLPGRSQPSYDKQFVRDYLNQSGWDKNPPAPELPTAIITQTARKYIEAYERITGIPFDPVT